MGDPSLDGDESLIIEKPKTGNAHPYFLRAKSGHLMDPACGEDEEDLFKNQSIEKRMNSSKKRPSSLLLSSGSKSDHFEEEEEDLANCLVMLSNKSRSLSSDGKEDNNGGSEKGMFQCKACKKIFNSHQALGGHRASHKNVKGCFAAKLDDEENVCGDSIQEENVHMAKSGSSDPTKKKTKTHECSVCHRVFSSGQALGGHKRCHWITASTDNAFIPSFRDLQYNHQNQKSMFTISRHHELDLNLNLPAGDSNITMEGSTQLILQQQLATATNHQQRAPSTSNDNAQKGCEMNKLRKLSDLGDVKSGGSAWLQMGTASTAI